MKSTKNIAGPLGPVRLATLLVVLLPNIAFAQDSDPAPASEYRLPPQDILDILDAPAPPSARLSPNQKWLVITERDVDYTTLAELAEPMLMLAGTRFKPYPDTRIENVGITRLTLRSIDGAIERTLVPPGEGRIGSVTWVRDSSTGGELAYTVMSPTLRGIWW